MGRPPCRIEAAAAYMRGDAVFMRQWPYVYDLLSDKKQSDISQGQTELSHVPVASAGMTPLNVGGGWSFFLNEQSENQDAAYKLVQYLTAGGQQKTMALEGSYLPTRSALYDDPQISEKLPAIRLGKQIVEQTTTPPSPLITRNVGGDGQAVQRQHPRQRPAGIGGRGSAG